MFRYVDKPLLLLCLSAMPAVALETSLGIRMETIQSDNILRTRDDAVDEIMYQPGATILVEHQGNSVIASANYDYERRIRTKDYYDDSSALIGRSELTWQALPGRMDFTVSNTRTESTVDRRLGPVQSNLQTTDSTRAGSTLRFRVRQNDELQLQYFHTLTRAQVGATDSNRDTLSASYVLNTGPKDRFTFNVTDNRVDFQESGAPDLNAVTSSVRWNRFGPATELNVQGGWTTMNRSGRDDISEPVWDTGLLWRLTPQMSLRFGVVREVRDRPFILEMGLLPFGSNSQIDSDLNEVFVNNRFEAEWRATFLNNDITLSWVFDRQDYFDILEDQERRTTTLGLRRQLTPKLLVQLGIPSLRRATGYRACKGRTMGWQHGSALHRVHAFPCGCPGRTTR
ncbi:MAG: hypothetical protein R3E84_09040 [Pseudomonadales bacterium]